MSADADPSRSGVAAPPFGDVEPRSAWFHVGKEVVGPAIILVVVALAVPGLWRSAGAPMEEGFMLVFPEQLLDGRLPHRDFLHLYGPGGIWVLAGAFWTFGESIGTERVVGLIQHMLVALGVYALLRPVGRAAATVSGVLAALIVLTPLGLAALAWDGALGLAVCGLACVARAIGGDRDGRGARAYPVIGGALVGLALLYRPDMAVALGVACLVAWRRMDRAARRDSLIGVVPVVALYVPHMLMSGIGDSIRGMLLEPLFELRPGRTLPVPPSWGTVDGYLQRTAALDIPNDWSLRLFGLSQQIFLWFVVAAIVALGLLVGAWWLGRRREDEPEPGLADHSLVIGGVWAALLFTQAMQRPDSAHLAWVTGVSLPIALGMGVHVLGRVRPTLPAKAGVGGAAAIALVFLFVVAPFFPMRAYLNAVSVGFGDGQAATEIRNGERTFLFGSASGAASAQEVVDRLQREARPGERLIVGTVDLSRTVYSDAYLYHLFPQLEVGTRFIEMDPGIADAEGSPLADELRASDWLILSTLWDGWNEPNTSSESRSDEANQVVREEYCQVLDAGAYQLWEHCGG